MNIVSSTTPKSYDISTSGWYLNNQWYNLPIRPDYDTDLIPECKLNVNGLCYDLDSYINSSGIVVGSGTIGFSLDFNYNPSYVRIKWNNIAQNYSGFNIGPKDRIILKYYET